MGMVFQHFNLFPHLTVRENLELAPRVVKGEPDEAVRRRSAELLDKVGLAEKADHYPAKLSGGQKQRVSIARALAQEAAALVMDEPTASLDFGNQARVLRQVAALAREDGLAVLMTTHQPDHALLAADEVAVLHGGRMIGPAPPEALITPERLREAYGIAVAIGEIGEAGGRRRACVPLV